MGVSWFRHSCFGISLNLFCSNVKMCGLWCLKLCLSVMEFSACCHSTSCMHACTYIMWSWYIIPCSDSEMALVRLGGSREAHISCKECCHLIQSKAGAYDFRIGWFFLCPRFYFVCTRRFISQLILLFKQVSLLHVWISLVKGKISMSVHSLVNCVIVLV